MFGVLPRIVRVKNAIRSHPRSAQFALNQVGMGDLCGWKLSLKANSRDF
jgi:hypothetical protein